MAANRWFLDTEFNEDGSTIDLISLAVVGEDGEERYWVSNEWDGTRCNEWLWANVLPHLPPPEERVARSVIKQEFHDIVTRKGKPEFWGYFADYDWVVICQLFGKMIDLPADLPMFCMDLKQSMVERGVKRDALPKQAGPAHNALADARWIRDSYNAIYKPAR